MDRVILIILCLISFKALTFDLPELWIKGYFHQDEVITPKVNEIMINAKINGDWNNFLLATFPKSFMKWNMKRRLQTISDIENQITPKWSGPHNGIVATFGKKREDTFTSLNNAVKGMGFLPKYEKIKEVIKKLESTINSPYNEKLAILKEFYQKPEYYFSLDRQISLELYSEPGFVTQSFLNQANNPISTIVYLDIPSWKFKAITQLLDPNDPTLGEYERNVVHYANLIHSYFHGHFTKQFIAVIYYAIEVFDNSPGGVEKRGTRIVPPLL